MSCKKEIEQYVESLDEGSIILAVELYEEKFKDYSEMAFFKMLERMAKSGYLFRVSKGIYARNEAYREIAVAEENQTLRKTSDYLEVNQSFENSEAVLNYYFGDDNDNGMFTGYRLYTKYGLTRKDNGKIELYSNLLMQETKNIGNIRIKRVSIELKFDHARVIEALEIFQNYSNIEGLNEKKVYKYAKQFAQNYNDDAAQYVLSNMKYKKSTIAAVKNVLVMYEVKNSLSRYLSPTSRYKVPDIKKV